MPSETYSILHRDDHLLVVAKAPSVQLSCAADLSDLPLHWGTGDRHAWDEGKP